MKQRGTLSLRLPLVKTIAAVVVLSASWAGAQEAEKVKTPLDLEIDFYNHLVDVRLFPYAELALEEIEQQFPNAKDRIEVLKAGLNLRLGRIEQVKKLLEGRDLSNDTKAQAILLRCHDHREFYEAWRGKREPRFEGR